MQKKNITVGICTLGCRVNQYESRAISEYLEARGIEISSFDSVCDAYVINTCAVTAESERKSRQMVRRAVKTNPNAAVFVTGCASQLHPELMSELPSVRYVGGNASKLETAEAVLKYRSEGGEGVTLGSLQIGKDYESYAVNTPDHTRAYVKIEDGCENRCAYCVIPKVRGPVRSKEPCEVIKEITHLADIGYKEIVLTGIETCSYQYGLVDIIKKVHEIEGIERIRLSSVNPSFINKRFADGIKDLPKFCPHFHLSLQSYCDRTLNAMRRRYNSKMITENCAYLRSVIPDVQFTADIICGFPGETDGDFEVTKENVKKLGLLFAHIFPYSDRPGTEASEMKDKVDEAVKNARCTALRETVNESRKMIISDYIDKDKEFSVLIETEKDGFAYGHTENFIEVAVPCEELPDNKLGGLFKVKLARVDADGTVYASRI